MWLVDDSQIYCKQLLSIPVPADTVIKEPLHQEGRFLPRDVWGLSFPQGLCTLLERVPILERVETLNYSVLGFFQ